MTFVDQGRSEGEREQDRRWYAQHLAEQARRAQEAEDAAAAAAKTAETDGDDE